MQIRLKTLLSVLGTVALLAYVAYSADLFNPAGRHVLTKTLAGVSGFLLVTSIGVDVLTSLLSTLKWHVLLRSQKDCVSFWRLFAYYMSGKCFSLILPTTMGGDVVRVHSLGRQIGSYSRAAASVFVDRLSGLLILVLLTVLAVVANLQMFGVSWLIHGVALAAFGLGVICWLVVDERPLRLVARVGGHIPPLMKPLRFIEKAHQAVLFYQRSPRTLVVALLYSLSFYLLAMFNIWLNVIVFQPFTGIWPILMVAPLIFFIRNIPLSIGDIGLSEFAYSFVLALVGVDPAVALSAALLLRLCTLLNAALGGLLYPFIVVKPSPDLAPADVLA